MTRTQKNTGRKPSLLSEIVQEAVKNKGIYIMAIPVLIYYILFHLWPMYGAIIAFKDFVPSEGILGSQWVGFEHFKNFFGNFYFWRLIKNTFLISLYQLIFGFPAPIILALLLNEVKTRWFKGTVQTVTYLPHFISLVVVVGMIKDFTNSNGIINDIIVMMGGSRESLFQSPRMFRTLYVVSGIWQEIGWGTIVYLSALAGIDTAQYEAAKIDGAGRFNQLLHVTLPGIMPTIIILLILQLGKLLNVGFEKIILMYNPATYETADVISSYVYRMGLQRFDWSFSTAVGLFNSCVNFVMLVVSNRISSKVSDSSLW